MRTYWIKFPRDFGNEYAIGVATPRRQRLKAMSGIVISVAKRTLSNATKKIFYLLGRPTPLVRCVADAFLASSLDAVPQRGNASAALRCGSAFVF
jgi:hypothetical protein